MMEDGECRPNMVITSEFKEFQDNTDDVLPTATSSHLQDEPCVAVTGGHEGDNENTPKQTNSVEAKPKRKEDEMLQLLGMVGKYLYEKKKKQSKSLVKKYYRKTFKADRNSFSHARSDGSRFLGAKYARKKFSPTKRLGKGFTGKSVRKAYLSAKSVRKSYLPPKSTRKPLSLAKSTRKALSPAKSTRKALSPAKSSRKASPGAKYVNRPSSPVKSVRNEFSPAKSEKKAPRNLRQQSGIDKDLSSMKENSRIISTHGKDCPLDSVEAMEIDEKCLKEDEKSGNSIYYEEEERVLKMSNIFGTKDQ